MRQIRSYESDFEDKMLSGSEKQFKKRLKDLDVIFENAVVIDISDSDYIKVKKGKAKNV